MIRQTAQRRAILQALEATPGPLTPQEIRELAAKSHKGLGLATVYRTLNQLEAEGWAVSVRLPGEATRFEPAGRAHHHHFRCENCNVVFELHAVCPVVTLDGALLPGGFRVSRHDLVLYGLCSQCQDH